MSKKRALLIGINHYPNLEARYQLNGCVRDAEMCAALLRDKFGFADENVRLLADTEATRDHILHALDRLVAETGRDDVVVIFYSGHGSQMTDREGDEADGLDETIMPYDSVRDRRTNRDITDDELHIKLLALREKTRFITLIFDCCHSGTIDRGASAIVRAVPPDLRPISELPPSPLSADQIAMLTSFKTRGATSNVPLRDGYVLLSACRDEELAYEYRNQGALTRFLLKALREMQSPLTYQELFEQIYPRVTAKLPFQHPQIQGDVQRLVFGTRSVQPIPYLGVGKRRGDEVTLLGGAAHGVTVGSRYAIYPPQTRSPDEANALTTATATAVHPTTTTAQLIDIVPLPIGCRAFETEHVYPASPLVYRLVVDRAYSDHSAVKQVRQALQASPYLRQGDTDADVVLYLLAPRLSARDDDPVPQLQTIVAPTWAVVGRDGYMEIPHRPLHADQQIVTDYLEKVARYNNVLLLKNNMLANPLRGKVQMELFVTTNNQRRPLSDDKTLYDGDTVEVAIRNNYGKQVYVSLLDLGLMKSVESLLVPASVAIAPGHSHVEPLQMFVPDGFPLPPPRDDAEIESGIEVFKLFVTLQQTDFRPLLQNAVTLRGEDNPFLEMFRSVLIGEPARDARRIDSRETLWDTTEISFRMSKRGDVGH